MTKQPLTRDLAEVAESLHQTLEARAKKEAAIPETPQNAPKSPGTSKVAQLVLFPQWADTRRAAPCAIFRSALFSALGRVKRPYLKNQKIAAVDGVEITFTGEQFDQSDLDVYLELLYLMKDHPSGKDCEFTAYGLLKALGRDTGKKDHEWLHSVLIRLCAGVVDMTDHKKRYFGQLLHGGTKDEITKRYTLKINPEFAWLFQQSWTSLEHEQRRKLHGHPTAKHLHAYYSSHAKPTAHRIAKLAQLAGVMNSNPRQRKVTVVKAHDLLTASDISFLSTYEVKGGTIKVQINHTTSQLRHIADKAAGKLKRTRKKDTG
jgi:hypothetical protein